MSEQVPKLTTAQNRYNLGFRRGMLMGAVYGAALASILWAGAWWAW